MPRPVGIRHCPHCGKPLRRGGAVTMHPYLPVLILSVVFFLWTRGSGLPVGIFNAQAAPAGRLPSGFADYISSPDADKSCGTCVGSALLATRREMLKDMARLRTGDYYIGSPDNTGDPDEHPSHQVRLDAFYIDKYEVTKGDYMKFVAAVADYFPEWAEPKGEMNITTGRDPYYRRLAPVFSACETCPVVGVTFTGAEAYCRSKDKRLPTEAEWESAARGGEATAYSFGETDALIGDYAWRDTNSDAKPHPVGGKKPNKYGLYDMHGNVFEWVSDYYAPDYYKTSPKDDPKGPPTGKEHVIRGGSYSFDSETMRSANRASTNRPNDDIGFRCAVSERALAAEAEANSAAGAPLVITRN